MRAPEFEEGLDPDKAVALAERLPIGFEGVVTALPVVEQALVGVGGALGGKEVIGAADVEILL